MKVGSNSMKLKTKSKSNAGSFGGQNNGNEG